MPRRITSKKESSPRKRNFKIYLVVRECEKKIFIWIQEECWLLLNIAGKMTTYLIFILPNSFANQTLYLKWNSLKDSSSIKIIIMMSTVISPSLLYHIVGNLKLKLISPDSSCFSWLYKYLLILFSYWSIPWLLLLTLWSGEKPYIRAVFSISLCTEESCKTLLQA